MDNEPVLYYFVGLPGSGKSFRAKELESKLIKQGRVVTYLSSDALRGEIYGDESCQKDPGFIFNLMHQRTVEAWRRGEDVIYDATNVNRKKRISFLKSIPYCKRICCIVWSRLETCIQRDSERDRNVGEQVIMKMVKQFQTPWKDEGWSEIKLIINDKEGYHVEDFNLDFPHDNPHHPGTVKEHVDRVELEVIREQGRSIKNVAEYNKLFLLAHLHDIGKVYTKSFVNSKGEVTEVAHYYDHQNVSAYLVLGMEPYSLDETPQPGKKTLLLSYLCNMHMEPFFNESNYYKNMDPYYRNLIEIFNGCDKRGA